MMKLVVLIPAFNEEDNIERTVLSVPQKISGIDEIKILVIDDGSSDKTVERAMNGGADKIISHKTNMGVGAAFMTGIRNAISMNADIVTTIDGDFQMVSEQIHDVVLPIVNKQFDVVIGSRFEREIPKDYPLTKKIGNKIFTKIISLAVGQKFSDTQSGFRAYSKNAILSISIVNDFTYTQEVLIDLKFKGFRIGSVPINIKYYRKNSKVVKSIPSYVIRTLSIITKSLIYHRPMLAFGLFGLLLIGGGVLVKLLTSYVESFYVTAGLTTGLIILGIVSFMMGGFASIVFKRQSFTEKDIRHFLKESNKDEL